MGELEGLTKDNVFLLEVGCDSLLSHEPVRGFDDDDWRQFGHGPAVLADPWNGGPDALDCRLGVRTLFLGISETSAPGVAYRWVPSDWRWDRFGTAAAILFRQSAESCDLYFVMIVADSGPLANGRSEDATSVCVQFDPAANRWQLVEAAERREILDSPRGIRDSVSPRAGDMDRYGFSATRYLIEEQPPPTSRPTEPPTESLKPVQLIFEF